MVRNAWLVALLLGDASAFADLAANLNGQTPDVIEVGRATLEGYQAEVEVSWRGLTQQGRIIVTRDGSIHLEHLDANACRWARDMLHHECSSSKGWNNSPQRSGPVCRFWRPFGQVVLPSEIGTPEGSIKFSRHRPISSR